MEKRDIIVIGSSAGGVAALQKIVAELPENLKASIFIVQHVAAQTTSMLPKILTIKGHMEAVHPEDGEVIRQGRIYVAPPDRHLLIEKDRILVKKDPKENRFRPSIDALFRSAAYNYGPRVIGIVLTGMLDDGTSGMWSVKRLGGLGIIQQPEDSQYPSMPASVLEYVKVDHILSLSEIAPLLVGLVDAPVSKQEVGENPDLKRMKTEIDIAAQQNAFEKGIIDMGELTPLTCPECNGALVKLKEGNLTRYRCHTGHSFHGGSLLEGQIESVETNLWEALKSMEEMIILLEHTADAHKNSGNPADSREALGKAKEMRKRAIKLHQFIFE